MLKYYFDWICQPSRALYILLKTCNIPFEAIVVSLKNSEHLTESFKSINRFQKLPTIVDDDGFQVSESVAILRYLSAKGFKIRENIYPKNHRARAKVEEYLSWQSMNIRAGGGMYFKDQWMIPRLSKRPPKDSIFTSVMISSLDALESIWLSDTNKKFLISNEISIAEIMVCCDLEQIRITGYNPFEDRPKLEKLWRDVKTELNPIYDETHAVCYKMSKSQQKF